MFCHIRTKNTISFVQKVISTKQHLVSLGTRKEQISGVRNVVKKKFRKIPLIFLLTEDFPDVNLTEITANGFPDLYKAGNNEKVREIMLGLLAEEGLPPRTEVPHPIPITQEVRDAISPRTE